MASLAQTFDRRSLSRVFFVRRRSEVFLLNSLASRTTSRRSFVKISALPTVTVGHIPIHASTGHWKRQGGYSELSKKFFQDPAGRQRWLAP